ncbi:uncharacterized protein LOC141900689 [Tubulanus polymorphus]|uniref:uncharacterized protein LOC141900689 n=1 Tax=Tubulanus polymorphus TaxID=672921 RepID=UPI003DA4C36D
MHCHANSMDVSETVHQEQEPLATVVRILRDGTSEVVNSNPVQLLEIGLIFNGHGAESGECGSIIQSTDSIPEGNKLVPSHHNYSKKVLECPQNNCSYKTEKQTNFHKHQKLHNGWKPYSCTVCDFSTTTNSNLKRHMITHTDERPHICKFCEQKFRQKVHLNRHIQYKHKEKKIKCPLCDYICASELYDLRSHMKRKHADVNSTSEPSVEMQCPKINCAFKTTHKKDLKQHMKFHAKGPELKLFCEKCSFVTDCASRLKRHAVVHTKERAFECAYCSYKASQKEHLTRHVKTRHKNCENVGTTGTGTSELSICVSSDVHNIDEQTKVFQTDSQQPKIDDASNKDLEISYPTNGTSTHDVPFSTTNPDFNSDSVTYASTASDIETNVQTKKKSYVRSDYSNKMKCFHCNLCAMKFHKLINLYKHLEGQHNYQQSGISSDYKCIVCDFVTKKKQNLCTHMRNHKSRSCSNTNEELTIFKAKTMSNSETGTADDGKVLKAFGDSCRETVSMIVDDTAAAVKGLESVSSSRESPSQFDSEPITIIETDIHDISSGDLLKINGQIYKVEISQDSSIYQQLQ